MGISPSPLQVLLPAADGARIAGLPVFLRNAQRARAELTPDRVIFCGTDGQLAAWRWQIDNFNGIAAPDSGSHLPPLDPASPLLVLASGAIAGEGALKRFVSAATEADQPLRCVWKGKTVASYLPSAKELAVHERRSSEVAELVLNGSAPKDSFEAQDSEWAEGSDAAARRRYEDAMFSVLPQATDGYIARFDRKISMAFSRLFVKTPITANQITTLSGVLGLYGAWLLAMAPYEGQVFGAALLWFCCILDGCDGEVARLKMIASPAGGRYDVIVDNIVHVGIFIAIPWHVHRMNPEAHWMVPGALLVSGLFACMFSVWWLVLRRPKSERGESELIIERLASRDFIYLIFLLTVIRKLEWFLWTVAVGSHLFNLGLWILLGRKKTAQPLT